MKLLLFLSLFAVPILAGTVTPKGHYVGGYKHEPPGKVHPNWSGRLRATPIQSHTDLSAQLHAVLDQGQEGSCVGFATAQAYMAAWYSATGVLGDSAPAFNYFIARDYEGESRLDNGCQIADAVDQLKKLGTCREQSWRYLVGDYARRPSTVAYNEASGRLVLKAYKVDPHDGVSVRSALSAGIPVIIGVTLYADFDDLNFQFYRVPAPRGPPIGGHAMLLYGSDDKTQVFKVRNQWSKTWGNNGDCDMPYSYLASEGDDCWALELVQTAAPNPPPVPPTPPVVHSWWWHLFNH